MLSNVKNWNMSGFLEGKIPSVERARLEARSAPKGFTHREAA